MAHHKSKLSFLHRLFITEIITSFFEAPTWTDARRVVERHPGLLNEDLATRVERMIQEQITKYHKTAEFRRRMEKRWSVLHRCQEVGVEAAFWEYGLDAEEIDIPPEFKAEWEVVGELEAYYRQTGDIRSLDKAIRIWEFISDHPLLPVSAKSFQLAVLNDSGKAYFIRYQSAKRLEDLYNALKRWQQVVELAPDDLPDVSSYLNNLSIGLKALYNNTGESVNLNQAIEAQEQAVGKSRPKAFDLPGMLSNVVQLRWKRYGLTRDQSDLDRLVEICDRLVATTPLDSSDLPDHLTNLGIFLRERYHLLRDRADLERAINICEKAVTETPPDSTNLPIVMINHGLTLEDLYELTNNMADLEHALALYRQAVSQTPLNSPDLPPCLAALSRGLRMRYQHLGERADLEEAITICEEALTWVQGDSSVLPDLLSNLGNALRERYHRNGNLIDLDRAIESHRKVVAFPSLGSYLFPGALSNLGAALRDHFKLTGNLADLEEAIAVYQEAVDRSLSVSPKSPKLATYKNNLGNALRERYRRIKNTADLEDAIQLHQEATMQMSIDSPGFANCLNSLGAGLAEHADLTESLTELDHAIQTLERAVAQHSPADPNLPAYLNTLATALANRYRWTKNVADLEQAGQIYEQAAQKGLESAAGIGLTSVRNWVNLAFEGQIWEEANRFYGYAHEFSERLFKVQIVRRHKESWIRQAQGLSTSIAYALAKTDEPDNLLRAVETVETGRARLLSETLERDRDDLDALRATHPELVNHYEQAANRIVDLERQVGFSEERSLNPILREKLQIAYRDLDSTMATIQQIPGYEDFFRTPSFKQIQQALTASHSGVDGPVVGVYLTATSSGGLALIVHVGGVKHVWLNFTANDLTNWLVKSDGEKIIGGYLAGQLGEANLHEALDDVLPRIGKEIIQPVASALDDILPHPETDQRPRSVILIPTGRLALLPLHAATYPVNGEERVFLDEFTVTYAPSARTVSHSRAVVPVYPNGPSTLFAIGNPLPLPEGVQPLAFARVEVEEIVSLFGEGATALYETQATRPAVEAALGTANHLHLACHGQFDPTQPLDSGLLLSDGDMLTLKDLLARPPLQDVRLALLSACQTAITDFNQLPDEVIGLPAGFLQAGVPGVIGTLWSVDDLSTALLMIKFYELHLRGDLTNGDELMPPDQALCSAQLWLRQVTNRELATYFDQHYQRLSSTYHRRFERMPAETVLAGMTRFSLAANPDACPFAHPYYWAPFIFVGA
ncbi:MAG: CHAT domain-containing protein [Anaerolineae bacterium]|nr:CHAT domain-containing protein [Anaerolineae bacterium]